MSTSTSPAPEEVCVWLASEAEADRQRAYASLLAPEFQVSRIAHQLRDLAQNEVTQARHVAAVAMARDRMFVPDLIPLLSASECQMVRIAAAHALFRLQTCPDNAVSALSCMLTSDTEAERQIAAHTLRLGAASRLATIADLVRHIPEDKLNLEALIALCDASQNVPGAATSVASWLQQLSSTIRTSSVKLAILAAIGRLTEGKQGGLELLNAIELPDKALRLQAMAALGSLGELGSRCWSRLSHLLAAENDEECEVALYRLFVALRTPPEHVPVTLLVRKIMTSSKLEILAGACMVLQLAHKEAREYLPYLAERCRQLDDHSRMPVAACHEILKNHAPA